MMAKLLVVISGLCLDVSILEAIEGLVCTDNVTNL